MRALWKTKFGRCIDQMPGVYVYQNFFYRWLTFDSQAIQTLIHRYQPHRHSLRYLIPFSLGVRTKPGTCCLLGLGGGGVVHKIQPYLKDKTITAVELDQNVIQMAYKHFMLESLENLKVIHQDAYLFIKTSQYQYMHILVDLYSAHHFPLSCQNADFFACCKQRLCENGIISMNLASIQDAWQILQHIRLIFGQNTLCIPVKGTANMVILAMHSSNMYFNWWLQVKTLKKIIWDSQWGHVGII